MVPTRRFFLRGTAAAALPVLFDRHLIANASAAPAGQDVVLEHIGRELASAAATARASNSVRGEQLRIVAANLRLLAAHGESRGFWTAAGRNLSRAVDDRGTAGAASLELPSRAIDRLRESLSAAGLPVSSDELARALYPSDTAARERAVAAVHDAGVQRSLVTTAAAIAALAVDADSRLIGGIVPAAARRQAYDAGCYNLWLNMQVLAVVLIAAAGTPAAPELAMALLFLQMYYHLVGCN